MGGERVPTEQAQPQSEGSPGRTRLQNNLISAQHGAVIRLDPRPHPGFPGWRWLETGRWRMGEGSGLMLEMKMFPWGAASSLLALAAVLAWQLERGPFEKLKMGGK